MADYVFEENHRVALAPAMADIEVPTVAELDEAIDITCDLTRDGLDFDRATESMRRDRWHNPVAAEWPGRWTVTGHLRGRRARQGEAEALWDAAVYRSRWFLVIRRGLAYDAAWAAGQVVEVLDVRFGKRSTIPSAANTRVTFIVPVFAMADVDEAVVA